MTRTRSPVVIVGAGPYGLAVAAHLRAADVPYRVFGEPLSFWRRHMPAGMLLRSAWEATHISDPAGELTLDRFEQAHGLLARPVRLDDFIRYATWFADAVAPDVDTRAVTRIDRDAGRLVLTLDDGEAVHASRVVVAGGIGPFASRPRLFDDLSPTLASHSSEHTSLAPFEGASVLVVGGGQSALESAALLHEAGARVEVVARDPVVHFLRGARLRRRLGPLRPIFYPSTDVGPPGLSLVAGSPTLFRLVPDRVAVPLARRCIRPAGAGWLVDRVREVPIHTGRKVTAAVPHGQRVRLALDDGSERDVDHVLLATGYRVDLEKYPFLPRELLESIKRTGGFPRLGRGFESSVPGLHFVGAPAAISFGPVDAVRLGNALRRPGRRSQRRRGVTRRELGVGGVVLGGDFQGLGIVRSLGRRGVPVCVLDDELSSSRFSRYATYHERVSTLSDEVETVELLLDAAARLDLQGWVLFPTRDETVAVLSRQRDRLTPVFRVPTPALGGDPLRMGQAQHLPARYGARDPDPEDSLPGRRL